MLSVSFFPLQTWDQVWSTQLSEFRFRFEPAAQPLCLSLCLSRFLSLFPSRSLSFSLFLSLLSVPQPNDHWRNPPPPVLFKNHTSTTEHTAFSHDQLHQHSRETDSVTILLTKRPFYLNITASYHNVMFTPRANPISSWKVSSLIF